MLKGKTVLLGVSGGIAAYKSASLASMLVKSGADVHVIMTENAKNFINPITFETLTSNKCITDTFDRNFQHNVEHVALAKMADVLMIAPATANVIGKMAHGIADDMLTTTFLACTCPIIVSPAMNTNMFLNPIVQDNIELLKGDESTDENKNEMDRLAEDVQGNMERLRKYNIEVIEPATGYLACGDTGAGKMPEPEVLCAYIEKAIAREKDLADKKVLVTAGATQEALDPVRYITNHSSGKMGYAIAKECMLRGAKVTLVSGETALTPPIGVEVVDIKSARDMFEAVTGRGPEQDIIIKAAAVADYRPAAVSDQKIKKHDDKMSLAMEKTDDILKYLGEHKQPGQILCGFSMETENMIANSRAKLEKKNLDMIIANNLKDTGAGFRTDTNLVTIIKRDGEKQLELMSKSDVAKAIIDEILGK